MWQDTQLSHVVCLCCSIYVAFGGIDTKAPHDIFTAANLAQTKTHRAINWCSRCCCHNFSDTHTHTNTHRHVWWRLYWLLLFLWHFCFPFMTVFLFACVSPILVAFYMPLIRALTQTHAHTGMYLCMYVYLVALWLLGRSFKCITLADDKNNGYIHT